MTRCQRLLALTVITLCTSAADHPAAAAQSAGSSASHGKAQDVQAHLEAALLLQTLNADLLSHESATATLERWCAEQRLAPAARIVIERVAGQDKAPTAEQRGQLAVGPTDTIRYRRVRLVCGTVVLSEADNWYVPERLTTEINTVLDTTDTPFGRAVRSLNFRRHTLEVRVLASLLPDRWWELSPAALAARSRELCLPQHVLEHRAILTLPDGTPFSEVVETYTADILTTIRAKLPACHTGE